MDVIRVAAWVLMRAVATVEMSARLMVALMDFVLAGMRVEVKVY